MGPMKRVVAISILYSEQLKVSKTGVLDQLSWILKKYVKKDLNVGLDRHWVF